MASTPSLRPGWPRGCRKLLAALDPGTLAPRSGAPPSPPGTFLRVAGALLTLVALAAGSAEHLVDEAAAEWLAAVAWTAAGVIAVGGLRYGARRVEAPQGRRAWGLLAVAASGWLAGQLAYDVYQVPSRSPSDRRCSAAGS
jgi:hypothetical protein